ncbi:hypothetical protein [Opitutus sp. ER46]|uniref:hypothetical protein n=1 Tax=Opitutus sp. ER46 TaxID=2161864 RepID=UPI000D30F1D6|nr:hypothetical protein [Opitutus sp. ER46]PTY01070.1 hypothetical protein DB354_00605 [Opitutus sp. ER46]
MHALPDYHPQRLPEPPAMVRVASQSDVTWNRPVFKAPPLVLSSLKFDPRTVAEEVRRGLQTGR